MSPLNYALALKQAKDFLEKHLLEVEKKAIKSFLADAYYSHEIGASDFQHLSDKVDKLKKPYTKTL